MKNLLLLEKIDQVKDHYLFYAIKSDLHVNLNQLEKARTSIEIAIEKTKNQQEKDHLLKKLKLI